MTFLKKTSVWLFLALFGLSSAALADKNKNQDEIDAKRAKRLEQLRLEWAAAGKSYGTCQLGIAFSDLDVNNVRARLYNTGGLFWKGAGPLYNVPQSGSGNAIFASGIWIGGLVNGELRMVASDYGPWELWPGPLDDNGQAPADCSQFDRMYKVAKQDVLDYEDTGVATADLADWPFDLGAPVIDGDGDPNNYNLAGGDRPDILGDQGIWWVMNDMGNEHSWSLTQPIGLEVQVLAFSFKRADALNNTTFYKYKLINKGGQQLTESYFGIWVDPDLGDAGDDYVGSDTARGVGFVWNGDDFDGGADGYADRPPALGYDFFQGPVLDADGNNVGATKFVYYNNDTTVQGNPDSGDDAYRYLRGLWRDDAPITLGGTGRGFSDTPVDFMFAGDPPAFWSEEDTDGSGGRNTPADRRFLMSSGPFTLDPGAELDIVYGLVWAQAADRFGSVQQMKSDDALAQAAFNVNFQLPPPPDPPRVTVAELDGKVVLSWSNNPSDNNYLDSYEVFNPFLEEVEVDDKTYTFEGYNVFQYTSENDQIGRRIATFDVVNGITNVVDIVDATTTIPIATLTAFGEDSGIQHSIEVANQTNYTDLYFGVQAYAVNQNSAPQVFKSAISRVVARPSRVASRDGGTVLAENAAGFVFDQASGTVTKEGKGGGSVVARVFDEASLTGNTYEVQFYQQEIVPEDDPEHPFNVTNYDIVNVTTGEKVFDGQSAINAFANAAPQGSDVLNVDGLSWTIAGPPGDALSIENQGPASVDGGSPAFIQVQGIDETNDACGSGAGSTFGCAEVGGNNVYGSFNGLGDWVMTSSGTGPEGSLGGYAPQDYEIRVTESGSYGYHPFGGDGALGEAYWVPFEVWDIGPTGPFGVNDPSDDVQMVANLFSDSGADGICFFGFGEGDDPFGLGWQITDRIYGYYATTSYDDWAANVEPVVNAHPDGCPQSPETDAPSNLIDFNRGRPIQRIVFTMDPTSANYREEMIPVGNVVRFLTTKPNLPGDVFTVNTDGFGAETGNAEAAAEALDALTVVPNPYKAVSDYELSNLSDVVRFTNMPEQATVRVFTLAGTLVKTIVKSGPETSIDWDLQTEEGLPIASGMYLIHVDVPGVGEKVIKFGVAKKRVQLDLL